MALVDLLAITTGFLLAVLLAEPLRTLVGADSVNAVGFMQARAAELALIAALTIGIFSFGGLYRRSGWELSEVRMIVAGIGLVALFDTGLQFMLHDHTSRIWAVIAYPLAALAVIAFRMALRSVPAVAEAATSQIIFIGGGIDPERLIYEMRESRAGPVRLIATVPFAKIRDMSARELDAYLTRLSVGAGVQPHRPQAVLAPAHAELDDAEKISAALSASQRPYSIVLPFAGLARNGLELRKVVGADMVMAELRPNVPLRLDRGLKRVIDILGALVAIGLLAPVLAFIILRLWFEDGPVFFKQLRVGRGGRRFWCYKFRTMRPDAQERLAELLASDPRARAEWNKYQKLQDDPRITAIGDFLRRTSLDELPQLFNVLIGDMSLVGPRPIIAPEVEGYPSDKAYHDHPDFVYYMECTPGITGLWQVSGRSNTSHEERVRLDRWYARNVSVWLDLMIVFKTFRAVVFRKGSV